MFGLPCRCCSQPTFKESPEPCLKLRSESISTRLAIANKRSKLQRGGQPAVRLGSWYCLINLPSQIKGKSRKRLKIKLETSENIFWPWFQRRSQVLGDGCLNASVWLRVFWATTPKYKVATLLLTYQILKSSDWYNCMSSSEVESCLKSDGASAFSWRK